MAPTFPSSLSPHVCILHSTDLQELLQAHSLPLLPRILQSFSPLSQVTARTTSLTSIPLSSFALRFSNLLDIESAIHEDEEQRAERTMDWIGNRVQPRCARWVDMVEAHATSGKGEGPWKDRTPWWEEVKRCVESDNVPNRTEGWNHPVAVIYAVSTMAVNPLQALQDLHSRTIDFPPWVDVTFLRYSLIVHPTNSPLSDPIAESLFNAVKKQYGLHTFLLPLSLPTSPLPAPVSIPVPTPRLPPIPVSDNSPMPPSQSPPASVASPSATSSLSRVQSPVLFADGDRVLATNANILLLCETDIQQFGRFTREFVTMSLVPWMEKAVVDWNELYSTSRRLPSRLFSSTRRLFGAGYASNTPPSSAPTHGSNSSISSIASRVTSHAPNSSVSSLASVTSAGSGQGGVFVTQQRRLAEFATILGDFKLAISIWESLRKESKGGPDVLPLLLSPSPALPLLALNAIQANHAQLHDVPAQAQMRSLVYAVRWDIGIDQRELLGNILEGERWFVQAAGAAEEVPTALLLAHAAFLSSRKGAQRRSALWYMRAADKLEKAGIKPLAMYFFRRSHQLYRSLRVSELSPSFWESEGRIQSDWRGFDAILPGIEHELGRLLYTTGDTAGAVKCFLGLLQEPTAVANPALHGLGIVTNGDSRLAGTDKVYLEDFRVALKHFKTTENERLAALDLKLPLKFSHMKQTRIRLPGDALASDIDEWKSREEDWAGFWKFRGIEKLQEAGNAAVNETFWLDLAIRNPLDVDVTLSALTVILREVSSPESNRCPEFVKVEVIDDIQLGAKEIRTIPIGIKSARSASLVFTHVTYDFLGLLPSQESLATHGRRLHDTPHQRQNKIYAPDILLKVEVEDAIQRLQANFVDDRHLLLAEGECKRMNVRLLNTGTNPINEIWLVGGPDDELWMDDNGLSTSAQTMPSETEIFHSTNSLAPRTPYRMPLEKIHSSSTLEPGEYLNISLALHAVKTGEQNLCVLLAFREAVGQAFHSARLVRQYDVRPIFHCSISSQPSRTSDHEFVVKLEVENKTSSSIRLTQVTTLSPTWSCTPLSTNLIGSLPPHQFARAIFATSRWKGDPRLEETREFVSNKLQSVLRGTTVEVSDPPPLRLQCRHLLESENAKSMNSAATRHFIHAGRRSYTARLLSTQHPHIPIALHRSIFPLYTPASLDFVIFWEVPSQERRGHIQLPALNLGFEHAPLREALEEVEQGKVKRSMYAETERERREVIRAVRNSEWNAEVNPVVVTVMDGVTVKHDFASSSCHVPVTFTLHNHSLTNPVRYVLTLPSDAHQLSESPGFIPLHFVGRLTRRGELAPSESTPISAKLLVPQAGSYVLAGWSIETEVGERSGPVSEGTARWHTRQRYQQGPQVGDRCCITTVDDSSR